MKEDGAQVSPLIPRQSLLSPIAFKIQHFFSRSKTPLSAVPHQSKLPEGNPLDTTSKTLDSLPNEILENIFRFLIPTPKALLLLAFTNTKLLMSVKNFLDILSTNKDSPEFKIARRLMDSLSPFLANREYPSNLLSYLFEDAIHPSSPKTLWDLNAKERIAINRIFRGLLKKLKVVSHEKSITEQDLALLPLWVLKRYKHDLEKLALLIEEPNFEYSLDFLRVIHMVWITFSALNAIPDNAKMAFILFWLTEGRAFTHSQKLCWDVSEYLKNDPNVNWTPEKIKEICLKENVIIADPVVLAAPEPAPSEVSPPSSPVENFLNTFIPWARRPSISLPS